MNLRTRLSIAFFVLLLGPLAIGGGALVDVASRTEPDRGTRASAAVRAVVSVRCRHLGTVAAGLAAAAASRGESYLVSEGAPAGPWALCGVDPDQLDLPPAAAYAGLAARAEIRDGRGELTGYAYAVTPVDDALLAELAAAAGAPVVPAAAAPATAVPLITQADQPLPLALATRTAPAPSPAPLATVAALVAVLVAAGLAWWLGRLATRPLRALLGTVRQLSAGDLTVRSRLSGLSGRDETGRLAAGLDDLISGMQETQRLSVTDALTGLGNLRQLTDSLRVEIERATRFNRSLGLLVIDLDHFKAVNDQYGHRAGDAVLVEFAARVRRVVREVDLAFRQGGEEFVILLPETDVPGSLTAARRLNEAVRDVAFAVDSSDRGARWIPVTVSIGVAVFPRHALTGSELLDAADRALYAAKDAGRDTYVLAGAPIPEQWAPKALHSVIDPGGASAGTVSP